ncbi:MAG: spermidine/putrescine ABC transporter substrate-binding protein [Candidatus Babeliales bacterium]
MKTATLSIRLGIILFWTGIIFLFLYSPVLKDLLREPSAKSINVFVWTDEIDPAMVAKFEEETGIQVYLSYFETNEELYAKMQYTKGEGYDLIMPSDFMVYQLAGQGLLKPLDKAKLNFFHRMNPRIMNLSFDPHNTYSLPFHMDFTSIGYDKRYYPEKPAASWDLIFNTITGAPRIGMTNDARESVLLAAKYLFGTVQGLDEEELIKLSHFLRKQKKRVVAYTDLRSDYLLNSGTAVAAVSQTSFIIRSMRYNPHVGLIFPPKTFVMLDSFVIPQASDKEALTYQFLNFLFRPDVLEYHLNKYLALAPTTDSFVQNFLQAYDLLDIDWSNVSFFQSSVPAKKINQIWLDLKSY